MDHVGELVEPLARLRARINRERALVTAFSGGVDSALLAVVAHRELGSAALAVTAVSPSLPESERQAAKDFARAHGLAHVEVRTDEAERPEYAANGGDRCYHCKSALFDALAPLAAALGGRIALGTTTDDLGEHRPGLRAAAERAAIAPLVDAGLDKAAVRAASAQLGLATADKPASACLASRIAYGDPVTPEVLRRVELAEKSLHELGFPVVRVRAHTNGALARLELPAADIPRAAALGAEIDRAVRSAGFLFCALDLAGYRSGRLNLLLADGQGRG